MKPLPPLGQKNVMIIRKENNGSPDHNFYNEHAQTLQPRVIKVKRV
jgi:hypothetical protein